MRARNESDDAQIVIENEFGGVILTKDTSANGARLKLEGLRTGTVSFLDPLELESICALGPEALAAIVSPEARP